VDHGVFTPNGYLGTNHDLMNLLEQELVALVADPTHKSPLARELRAIARGMALLAALEARYHPLMVSSPALRAAVQRAVETKLGLLVGFTDQKILCHIGAGGFQHTIPATVCSALPVSETVCLCAHAQGPAHHPQGLPVRMCIMDIAPIV
jgi:hypothetical protein